MAVRVLQTATAFGTVGPHARLVPTMNVTQLLLRHSDTMALTHVRTAVVRSSKTFSELARRVGRFAHALRKLRVHTNDTVLILASTSVEVLEAILSCCNVGAVAMPVSPLLGTQGIERIIRQMRPKCCIFDDIPVAATLAALQAQGSCLVSLKARHQEGTPEWHEYERVLEDSRGELGFPEFDAGQAALIVHSSGSEGQPTAIRMSHGAVRSFLEHNALLYSQFCDPLEEATGRSAAQVAVLPVSHLGGLGLCLQGLLTGRSTYLMSFFVPAAYLRLIAQARCSFISLVPSMYRSLLREPGLARADLSALRFCITLGEVCTAELAAEIAAGFGALAVSAYGQSECISGIAHARRELWEGRVKPGSCGTLCFGEVKLLDARGEPNDEFGELWVRNPTVHRCYPDESLNESRIRDGWFRSKDLFFRDADGCFFHRGRCDDMFVCNGQNVYPAEVERLLLRHPAIDLAYAAAVRTADQTLVPAALIRTVRPVSEGDVLSFCARNGQSHAVPRILHCVEELPQAGPGKIDRIASRKLLQELYDGAACKCTTP